jgi:predicted NAD/FAD-binding protein
MNRLQSLDADDEYCVTLNRTHAIDPGKIIRTIAYAHPVYTVEGHAAQRRYDEVGGRNRTHYCGAYWGWGFHEDGVASAHRAVAALGREAVPA